MNIEVHKTQLIRPGDCLYKLLDTYLPKRKNNQVVILSAKVISLLEGRIISKEAASKHELSRKEAEATLKESNGAPLTLKCGLILPYAGIDESSGNQSYILYPKNPQKSAENVWRYLRNRDNIENLGIIITDSRSTPLRRGSTGVGIGWCGFKALYSYVGKPDCYGASLEVSEVNLVDSLAASAVLMMGEGDERTPFATIQEAPRLSFQSISPSDKELKEFYLTVHEDLYAPLYKELK